MLGTLRENLELVAKIPESEKYLFTDKSGPFNSWFAFSTDEHCTVSQA